MKQQRKRLAGMPFDVGPNARSGDVPGLTLVSTPNIPSSKNKQPQSCRSSMCGCNLQSAKARRMDDNVHNGGSVKTLEPMLCTVSYVTKEESQRNLSCGTCKLPKVRPHFCVFSKDFCQCYENSHVTPPCDFCQKLEKVNSGKYKKPNQSAREFMTLLKEWKDLQEISFTTNLMPAEDLTAAALGIKTDF
jgi:hypothetical protein